MSKMFVNIAFTDEEFEEKVKIAMDKYCNEVIYANLDEQIAKVVDKRIESLLSASCWRISRKIQGVTFEEFVNQRTEKAIGDFVEKNIREIMAKRFAEILTDKSMN